MIGIKSPLLLKTHGHHISWPIFTLFLLYTFCSHHQQQKSSDILMPMKVEEEEDEVDLPLPVPVALSVPPPVGIDRAESQDNDLLAIMHEEDV